MWYLFSLALLVLHLPTFYQKLDKSYRHLGVSRFTSSPLPSLEDLIISEVVWVVYYHLEVFYAYGWMDWYLLCNWWSIQLLPCIPWADKWVILLVGHLTYWRQSLVMCLSRPSTHFKWPGSGLRSSFGACKIEGNCDLAVVIANLGLTLTLGLNASNLYNTSVRNLLKDISNFSSPAFWLLLSATYNSSSLFSSKYC